MEGGGSSKLTVVGRGAANKICNTPSPCYFEWKGPEGLEQDEILSPHLFCWISIITDMGRQTVLLLFLPLGSIMQILPLGSIYAKINH